MTSLILLTALWWLLAGDEPASWVIGAPAIGAAWVIRRRLNPFPPWRASPSGAVRYLFSFLKMSLIGGTDVVRRALHPRLPLNPGLIEHGMRLTSPAERLLVAGTVNLQPGTLSVDLFEGRLTVHALDIEAPVVRELQQLENLVAGLRSSPPPGSVSGGDDHG